MIIFHHPFRESSSKLTNRSSINSNNLYIPCFRSNRLQRSVKYQGVMVWNSIPLEIPNLSKFAFRKTSQRILHTVVFINYVKFLSHLSHKHSIILYCLLVATSQLFGWLLDSMTDKVYS